MRISCKVWLLGWLTLEATFPFFRQFRWAQILAALQPGRTEMKYREQKIRSSVSIFFKLTNLLNLGDQLDPNFEWFRLLCNCCLWPVAWRVSKCLWVTIKRTVNQVHNPQREAGLFEHFPRRWPMRRSLHVCTISRRAFCPRRTDMSD